MKREASPPDWIDRFLEWYCSTEYLEEVQGDLWEWYQKKYESVGQRKANYLYLLAVVRYVRPFRLKPVQKLLSHPQYFSMKNLIKFTFRNLKRDKTSAGIRLSNIVLGISAFLVAWIYSSYELKYDQYHKNSDRVFRVGLGFGNGAWAATPMGLGLFAQENIQEIDAMTRFMPVRETWIRKDDRIFTEKNGFWADSSVFKVFSYEILKGNPHTALTEPNAIVLTESLAKKYFGNEDPLGQRLELALDQNDNGEISPRIVTAVIRDLPEQSHLQFDFLCSPYSWESEFLREWRNFWVYTYLLLNEGFDDRDIENVKAIIKAKTVELRDISADEASLLRTVLTPVTRIHLHTNHEKEYADNGNIYYVYILSAIGLFVLIISCINYINLTIIKGLDRSKEIGLRKTVGASRSQLITQFLLENFIFLLLSGITCLVLLIALENPLRQFTGLNFTLNVFKDPSGVLVPLFFILIILEIASGIYPAFLLSRFKPVDSIKSGTFLSRMKGVGITRKVLMISQFCISLVLIIGSLVVYSQLKMIQDRDLGFNKDQILLLRLNRSITNDFDAFENRLLQTPGIRSISTSSSVPGYRVMMEGAREMGKSEGFDVRLLFADETFIETYDIDLLDGERFDRNLPRDKNEFIINEKASQIMFPDKDPLGSTMIVSGDTGKLIGIVKDFNFKTLHSQVDPLVIRNLPVALFGYASIKFDARSTGEVLDAIEKVSDEIYGHLPPLNLEFLDNRFELLYEEESKLQTVVWAFCVLTIALTISGIFGVASYTAHKRAKEIAIRKVLGGDLPELLKQLSRGFVHLFLIAMILGVPGAWYLSKWWLESFAYRVHVGWLQFIMPAILLLLIITFCAGFVTLKTAKANPAETLKNE